MLLRSTELDPNPENATLEQILVAMEAAPNKRSYIRLSAIRTLLLGHERKVVCQIFGRTDRMVRLWIELFNRGGVDALITRPKPGRPRKVKLERVRDLLLPVLANPAQAGHGPSALDRCEDPRLSQGPISSRVWLSHHHSVAA